MHSFVSVVARELERPRPLIGQVVDHLCSHYDVSRDTLGRFLAEELPRLEDYEVDLALSPLFTPTVDDQACLSELLDRETLAADAFPALVAALVNRPTVAHLITEDSVEHPVVLRAVSVERFVTRLNLDRTLPERFSRLLGSLPPPEVRARLKAIARRPIWFLEDRADILFQFLVSTASGDDFSADDVAHLLKLVETYQPRDAAELLARIPTWQEVLKREIQVASSPRPFFNERIRDMHGGGRDQRGVNDAFVAAKQRESAFLERLKRVIELPNGLLAVIMQ